MATNNSINNNSSPISVATLTATTGITFDSTHTLGTYVARTAWTPVLSFGGGTTGITYTTQEGYYSRVGDMVYFWANILLSSKGSSTGTAEISIPYGTSLFFIVHSVYTAVLDLPLSGSLFAMAKIGSSSISFASCSADGTNIHNVSDGDFNNTTGINLSGFYWV